jgi:predicted metal-dependent enzyme (double-stranded beta helix superfamily)
MSAPSPWPADLDALIAAPDFHRLILENEHVRVLDVVIPPGALVPVHTHCWPGVQHILSRSDMIRRDANGIIDFDSRQLPEPSPSIVWSAPYPPHSVENIGTSDIHVIVVEIKK